MIILRFLDEWPRPLRIESNRLESEEHALVSIVIIWSIYFIGIRFNWWKDAHSIVSWLRLLCFVLFGSTMVHGASPRPAFRFVHLHKYSLENPLCKGSDTFVYLFCILFYAHFLFDCLLLCFHSHFQFNELFTVMKSSNERIFLLRSVFYIIFGRFCFQGKQKVICIRSNLESLRVLLMK